MERKADWRKRLTNGADVAGDGRQEVRNMCRTGVALYPWPPADGVVACLLLT
jgi:hypothetical protein